MSLESTVSRAILRAHAEKLDRHLESDVVVAGAGPAGMVCAWRLALTALKAACEDLLRSRR